MTVKTKNTKTDREDDNVLQAVLQERLRISRELHDCVLQLISTVKLRAEVCRCELIGKPRELQEALLAIEQAADNAVVNIRRILADNQAQTDLKAGTLERRLREEMKIFQARAGLKIEFRYEAGQINLPHRIERELYFALREAVINAIRHSRASELRLAFSQTDTRCTATLNDNGVGFDPSLAEGGGHYGLRGMRERIRKIGGQLHLDSAVGKGTRVTITIPVGEKSGAKAAAKKFTEKSPLS
jgi:signal transduction histidine kinase